MPTLLGELCAWGQLDLPVRIGTAEPGTVIVEELATQWGYEHVTAVIAGPERTRRSVQLGPLHLANGAIMDLLTRPVFADGVWIAAAAHQLGFVLDEQGEMAKLWLAPDAPAVPGPTPWAVGTAIGTLLAPVAGMVTRCSGLHERAVATVAAESAIAGLFRTARAAGEPDYASWLGDASTAVASALGARATGERLHCRPDEGPAVVLPSRRLCCALSAKVSCGSCPDCPKMGTAAERERNVTGWLALMDDAEFLETAGRPRYRAEAARS